MTQENTIDEDAYAKFCFAGKAYKSMHRKPLTAHQKKVYNLARVGWNPEQISKRLSIPRSSVYDSLVKIKHNGWDINEKTDRSHGR